MNLEKKEEKEKEIEKTKSGLSFRDNFWRERETMKKNVEGHLGGIVG